MLDQQIRPARRPAIRAARGVARTPPVATALLLPLAAWAADPIDDALGQRLKAPRDETTAGMTECTHTVYRAYDRQVNTLYQTMTSETDPVSRETIHNTQRAWLAYWTTQKAVDNAPWWADTGSVASPDIEGLDVEATRVRIAELEYYPRQPGGRDATVDNLPSPCK